MSETKMEMEGGAWVGWTYYVGNLSIMVLLVTLGVGLDWPYAMSIPLSVGAQGLWLALWWRIDAQEKR